MPRLEVIAAACGGGDGQRIEEQRTGFLGVDVGSTSTKAVIMDESGTRLLAKNYLMTAGKAGIDAVKQVFQNLIREGAANVTVAGVGVTGSGRYLVGSFIGADLIKNEITAQTRAAAEIDPEADIIEIGGQDSKLVIKRNGVVVDYQMNKACAAGTGSFIDELADMMGVRVNNGDFARLAFSAPYTIDLGTRCAAFMGQSVVLAQQKGVPLEVITASLANSIAKNYLSKVVEHRRLGDKVILTGAVFYNQAVVSAFHHQLAGKKLTVPEHKEVSGAIGAALLAKEAMAGASRFRGFQDVVDRECKLTTFVCKGCDNNCTITRMEMPGEKATYLREPVRQVRRDRRPRQDRDLLR
jgi:predicted CoA-substrate-specific enzyme activase